MVGKCLDLEQHPPASAKKLATSAQRQEEVSFLTSGTSNKSTSLGFASTLARR